MICPKCSHDNPDGAVFCSGCGAALPAEAPRAETVDAQPYEPYTGSQQYKTNAAANTYSAYVPPVGNPSKNGFAIASLCCGIASIVCCCFTGVGLVLGILGLVFGILSLKSQKRTMAIVGLVFGACGAAIGLFYIIVYVLTVSSYGGVEGYLDYLEKLIESNGTQL